jgi:uncharacterized protein
MNETDRQRWAIFSDTHGNLDTMRDALMNTGPFDTMIHLGDGVLDAAAVSRERKIPLIAVSGNEDGVSEYPERLSIPMGSFTAILLHGHRMDVNPYQPAVVWERQYGAMDAVMAVSGAQLLLFGHTHVPALRRTGHGIICNPGSHFIGSQTPHTFAIAETAGGSLKLYLVMKNNGGWDMTDEAMLRGPG